MRPAIFRSWIQIAPPPPPNPVQSPFPNSQVIPTQPNINVPPDQANNAKRPATITYFVIADIILYGLVFFGLIIFTQAILFIVPFALIFYVSEFFFWKGKKWALSIRRMFLILSAMGGFPIGTAYFVIGELMLKKQDVKDYFGEGSSKFTYILLGILLLILLGMGIYVYFSYQSTPVLKFR